MDRFESDHSTFVDSRFVELECVDLHSEFVDFELDEPERERELVAVEVVCWFRSPPLFCLKLTLDLLLLSQQLAVTGHFLFSRLCPNNFIVVGFC